MEIDSIGTFSRETWSVRQGAAQIRESARLETPQPPAVDREVLEERVARINHEAAAIRNDLRFSIHEKSGQMVVEIVDPESGKVLRQSPPKEFLDLAVRLQEMVGVFLDEKK